MTMAPATPQTPDLTAERGGADPPPKDANGNNGSNGEAAHFDSGSGNSNGINGGGGNNGKHRKKNKKRNKKQAAKSKKSRSERAAADGSEDDDDDGQSPSSAAVAVAASGTSRDDNDNDCLHIHSDHEDHKHPRDVDDDGQAEGAPSSKRSRRHAESTIMLLPSSIAHNLLYAVFFALGTAVTLPLLFSTCAHLGCGGGRITSMVDEVLIRKSRGETAASMLDQLNGLPLPGGSVGGVDVGNGGDGRSRKKSGRKNSFEEGDTTGGEDGIESALTIQEGMCQVSSLAIGHFAHYLPYAQFLVLRNPLVATVDHLKLEVEGEEEPDEEEEERRMGMFRRVLSRHKQKRRERKGVSSAASEEIDRKHPLRHILEGASIFSRHRKERRARKREEKRKNKQQEKEKEQVEDGEIEVDWKKWKFAMTDDYDLKSDEVGLINDLAKRVASKAKLRVCGDAGPTDCNDDEKRIASLSGGADMPGKSLRERLDSVPWGGIDADSNRWWPRKDPRADPGLISAQSEGGRLLAGYLKIMQWPQDLRARYPFRLCAKGCDSEVSLLHTLEWREKYRPWCMSDSSVRFNRAGFIYSRGHSRAGRVRRSEWEKSSRGDPTSLAMAGHSMVYYRPGLASPSKNPDLYGRTMINVLEKAVADSLVRNDGTIGRFNVVMDCAGMGSKNSPAMADVKKIFSVMQDHLPDRLGVLLAVNLSGLTQMLMKMVLPFVTEDVRTKIHIIPNGEEERREMLLQFMDEEEVPHYLGGKDEYIFDSKEYYQGGCILPEEGILEYKTTMPYHA